jgi:hypothetical protein
LQLSLLLLSSHPLARYHIDMLLTKSTLTTLLATLYASNAVSALPGNHLHEPRRVSTTTHHATSTPVTTASSSTASPSINLGYSTVRAVAGKSSCSGPFGAQPLTLSLTSECVGNSSIGYYKYQNIR